MFENRGLQLLGQIKQGSCRPRAILFKVLADTVCLESRLMVVRFYIFGGVKFSFLVVFLSVGLFPWSLFESPSLWEKKIVKCVLFLMTVADI